MLISHRHQIASPYVTESASFPELFPTVYSAEPSDLIVWSLHHSAKTWPPFCRTSHYLWPAHHRFVHLFPFLVQIYMQGYKQMLFQNLFPAVLLYCEFEKGEWCASFWRGSRHTTRATNKKWKVLNGLRTLRVFLLTLRLQNRPSGHHQKCATREKYPKSRGGHNQLGALQLKTENGANFTDLDEDWSAGKRHFICSIKEKKS